MTANPASPKPFIKCIISGGLLSNEGGVNMRKICVKYVLLVLFAFLIVYSRTDDICEKEYKILKKEICTPYIFEHSEIMEVSSSIYSVTIFVILTFIMVDSYFVKSSLWKAVLPVFWGCKFRIQSPRCKLTKSNICSVFVLIYFLNRCILSIRDFDLCFCSGRLGQWIIKKC